MAEAMRALERSARNRAPLHTAPPQYLLLRPPFEGRALPSHPSPSLHSYGLLAHDQNDVGTLGSLPCAVDRALLQSWLASASAPRDELLRRVVEVIPQARPFIAPLPPHRDVLWCAV